MVEIMKMIYKIIIMMPLFNRTFIISQSADLISLSGLCFLYCYVLYWFMLKGETVVGSYRGDGYSAGGYVRGLYEGYGYVYDRTVYGKEVYGSKYMNTEYMMEQKRTKMIKQVVVAMGKSGDGKIICMTFARDSNSLAILITICPVNLCQFRSSARINTKRRCGIKT